MSEDFTREAARAVGPYLYYSLGSTTLSQLRKLKIIPPRDYTGVAARKPDALLTYQSEVVAVIEHKAPDELAKDRVLQAEIRQKSAAARALCNLLIITDDATTTYWINPHTQKPVTSEDGSEIRTLVDAKSFDNIGDIDLLVQRAHASLDSNSSQLKKNVAIDPTPLAQRLWQSIWVATGKSPVECLYNVVELFIFKFLSDLNVLPEDQSFENIRNKSLTDSREALRFYAANTRKTIYELFPKGDDGTTIINGTIFVNEYGEANFSQATLFKRSLEHLSAYENEFGRFTQIDQQFKTKLYESFLKQEVQALGQYFTPRMLVQSIIRMAGVDRTDFVSTGKRICDPFCGVGGFALETLNLNPNLRSQFKPNQAGKITLDFSLHGFDKGFERDDERTIILAKANMLIYLAELLFQNPQSSKEFARVFNDTFHLFKDNLGTFGKILPADERYDLILSNPPYVTSGTSIIKDEIAESGQLKQFYKINALGLEGLSIEWIVRSLRPGGSAYVVVPDGILGRVGAKKLRDFVLRECYLEAIVSLPPRTFFSNFESTYILVIRKKNTPEEDQAKPVFTYIATSIGERLTSVRREPIPDNDLLEMERLFRVYKAFGDEPDLAFFGPYARCKLLEIETLQNEHWVIDRRWSTAEKVALGIVEEARLVGREEMVAALDRVREGAEAYADLKAKVSEEYPYAEVQLGNRDLFSLSIGKRVLKSQRVAATPGTVPVYSSNVRTPFGHVVSNRVVKDVNRPSILWGIDGVFDFNLIPAGELFAITDHTGRVQVAPESGIDEEYLVYELRRRISDESFDRSFRASLANMRTFTVSIPVKADGTFDEAAQGELAAEFVLLEERRRDLREAKSECDEMFAHFVASSVA
jgi:type I restriction enzyme M protein